MRWAEISVEATEASADATAEILMNEGCGGTVYDCPPGGASTDSVRVSGYLPVSDRLEQSLVRVRSRLRALPALGLALCSDEIAVKWVEDTDWATAWRKYFKPIRIGRVVVKPSWEEFSPDVGDVVVELDPGMAFGTGSHESTKLCLLALQDYVKPGDTVLDVGTGSGILAIAAARLGASEVIAIDNDMAAVDAARQNAARAGLADVLRVEPGDSPSLLSLLADVTVANIVPNVIIPMSGGLAAATKPGGVVITSGIVRERAEEVARALEASGLSPLETRADGDWVALVSAKRT